MQTRWPHRLRSICWMSIFTARSCSNEATCATQSIPGGPYMTSAHATWAAIWRNNCTAPIWLSASQRVQKKDLDEAKSLYQLATALQVSDTSEAEAQLVELAEQEATPVPTPVPPKPVVYAEPAPAPPTPTPVLTQAYHGWIAFRTSRNGRDEIFVMRPDGIDQQPAPAEIASQFDTLYDNERWSPDHTRESIRPHAGKRRWYRHLYTRRGRRALPC